MQALDDILLGWSKSLAVLHGWVRRDNPFSPRTHHPKVANSRPVRCFGVPDPIQTPGTVGDVFGQVGLDVHIERRVDLSPLKLEYLMHSQQHFALHHRKSSRLEARTLD